MAALPVSRVVNVTVDLTNKAAASRNFGAMLILGASDIIRPAERIRSYSSAAGVAQDFGADAPEYGAAVLFFSQSPKPSTVYVGRWAKTSTPGSLRGASLNEDAAAIANFNAITNGAFDVTVDGSKVSVATIDLSGQTNLNGVASAIDSALGYVASCRWTGDRFVIESASSGSSSGVTGITSTPLSQAMGLAEGTTEIAGANAETLTECVNKLLDYNQWYGLFVAADYGTEDALGAAAAIEAASPSRVVAFSSQDANDLDSLNSSSLAYKLHAANYNRSFAVYSGSSAYAAASVLGRMSTVNFNGSNTTITLKFKNLPGVVAESLRTSQADALKAINENVFAAYQNDVSILQEGTMAGGDYIDEIHGLDWLQDRIQTDLFNLLYGSGKVAQDERGMTAIIATVNKALDQAVANELVAPGVWNGEGFGALSTGDTLSTGYYVYIQPLAEQAQSDREARKAPPIQIAVKLAGAVHFIDCMITVNR